ncbi:Kelch repeat-containing protein [Candidatus Zixiibacteriota bacterium]
MKRSICVVFAIILSFCNMAYAVQDWNEIVSSPHPDARSLHAMAYIGSEKVLLFGGQAPTQANDTWVYDLNMSTWAEQDPASKPSQRDGHAMAHIGGDRVLLFGGHDGSNDDETWIYDLSESAWTQQSPASRPSPRSYHAMAYIGGDKVLLFGGYGGSGSDDETWIYDLSEGTWAQQGPASRPSARGFHDMAYIGRDQVLLFGGYDGDHDDETWIYDLSEGTWIQQYPASKPSARFNHAMAYIGLNRVLLFGGNAGGGKESWVYDHSLGDWVYDLNPVRPPARVTHGLAATSMSSASPAVLFGGDDDGKLGDTRIFGGGDFSMEDPNRVVLISPNGGEVVGDSVIIAWTVTDPDPGDEAILAVDLAYSSDAGASWNAIAEGLSNDGAYIWDTSELHSSPEYSVSITARDPTDLLSDTDASDSLFTIKHADPHISSIVDVPQDQGEHLIVQWDRSYLDDAAHQSIIEYSIWRKSPLASHMESYGEEWDGTFPEKTTQTIFRRIERKASSGEIKTEYWELMGTVAADYSEGYAFTSPTLWDSFEGNPAYFSFIITANTEDPFVHWDSAPDSSYSVDNVSPAKAQVGIMASGSAKGPVNTIWLVWDQVTTGDDGSPEQGQIDYHVYCDETFDFAPGPGNLVATTSDLSYPHTDSRIGDPAVNLYYLVTAVDQSGNESAVSNVVGEFDRSVSNVK